MIQETCSCGASIQYPDLIGMAAVVDWRQTHRHNPKEPTEPEKQGAGFASVQKSPIVTPPAKFTERVMA